MSSRLSRNAEVVRAPELRQLAGDSGRPSVTLAGAWDIRALESRARTLSQGLRDLARRKPERWDLYPVQRLDHVGALLLWQAWGRRRPDGLALRAEHERFFDNLEAAAAREHDRPARRRAAPVHAIGDFVLALGGHAGALIQLLGMVVLETLAALRRPARAPWRETSAAIYRIGAQALPITAAVGFLIGISLSYLSAEQLKTFGANVFIVNILGIGVIRELGPVICAVLVAGRSGSAITAQLGVMRVTEELDAMSVMGLSHGMRLVLPKVIALILVLPLLMLWTSGVALLGGAIAAQLALGIEVTQFALALPEAVPAVNLWLATGKGVVFGVLIALIACHFGLRIEPNTESLGAGTTRSVVTSITAVIVADAVFAIVFRNVGIQI